MRQFHRRGIAHTPQRRPSLGGLLEIMPLADVLGTLHVNRRSARVQVCSGDAIGIIDVIAGRPVSAIVEDTRGSEAALQLLALGEGEFRVDFVRVPGVTTNVTESLAALLIEARRRAKASGVIPDTPVVVDDYGSSNWEGPYVSAV